MAATRLLVLGDGGAPTGYARVTENILKRLPPDRFEVHHLAVNYSGDPHDLPWKLYPAGNRGDAFGGNRIKELLDQTRPDLIFSVADLWIQKVYLQILLAEHAYKGRIVLYSPVDAGPVDPDWVAQFNKADRIVAFTHFAKREIEQALPAGAGNVDVIPVGVDAEVFHPLATRGGRDGPVWDTSEAKRLLKLFPEEEIESSFLVLNAHRNQPRKRIDITLKAFAAFARGKPKNVQLYLHMGIEDAGWHVLKLAKRYGVDDRIIVSENRSAMPAILSEHLNLIYNACDVGLNTATGEGWGLPNFEHAATGKAQIVPRIGALAEIWSEAAELVEPSYPVVYEGVLSDGNVVAVEDVAAGLERLYKDRQRCESVAGACYARATSAIYQWGAIGKSWRDLFKLVTR
jgi:glycosyltransferase involved in cell wall biosynthesis